MLSLNNEKKYIVTTYLENIDPPTQSIPYVMKNIVILRSKTSYLSNGLYSNIQNDTYGVFFTKKIFKTIGFKHRF